jgi:hypothetical protein
MALADMLTPAVFQWAEQQAKASLPLNTEAAEVQQQPGTSPLAADVPASVTDNFVDGIPVGQGTDQHRPCAAAAVEPQQLIPTLHCSQLESFSSQSPG